MLKHYREKAKMTRKELANAVGLTPGAIGHFENKIRKPSLKTSYALVAALRARKSLCTVDKLFPPEDV